ncbi:MAG: phage tail protein [Leptothrix sp. (in: Bacteria)]|nr:phage tail protein [Leptothrix sp. (in: b-proteobacteria)]
MADPFIGEIKMFAGNFPPRGYAFCDGQLIAIAQNTALFSLLGTYYGGDGRTTFALPDLRGRVPLHEGQGPGLNSRQIGERLGSETSSLSSAQMPMHSHAQMASTNSSSPAYGPSSAPGAATATAAFYGNGSPQIDMAAAAVDATGAGQPHSNMAPYGTLSFIIAVQGIFPSRN